MIIDNGKKAEASQTVIVWEVGSDMDKLCKAKSLTIDFTNVENFCVETCLKLPLPDDLESLRLEFPDCAVLPRQLPESLRSLSVSGYFDDITTVMRDPRLKNLTKLGLHPGFCLEPNCFCHSGIDEDGDVCSTIDLTNLNKLERLSMTICEPECMKHANISHLLGLQYLNLNFVQEIYLPDACYLSRLRVVEQTLGDLWTKCTEIRVTPHSIHACFLPRYSTEPCETPSVVFLKPTPIF